MARKVGARRQEREEGGKKFVMVVKNGRTRMEAREDGKVLYTRRVARRNRYKG